MAYSGKLSSSSGMVALDKFKALPARRVSIIFGKRPVLSAVLPGTGFKNPPPLAILFKPFQFLKSLSLKSVGLGFDCVPFHSGWELVEWKPKLPNLKVYVVEVLEICDFVEEIESIKVFGPQIELDLGEGSSIYDDEPPVEVAKSVVEVKKESSVEVLEVSVEKDMRDQAVKTGLEPVLVAINMVIG